MTNALLKDDMSSAINMNQTSQLTRSMILAARLAPSLGHSQVVPAHLLLVLLEDADISFLLNAYGVDIKEAKTSVLKLFPKITPNSPANIESVPVSNGLNSVLAHAQKAAQKNKLETLDSTFMFATLLREEGNFSKVLEEYDLSYDSVTQFIQMQTGSNISIDPVPTYTIDDNAYLPPPPKPAKPIAAPVVAAVPSPPPADEPAPTLTPTPADNLFSSPQNAGQVNPSPTPQSASLQATQMFSAQEEPVSAPSNSRSKVISFSNILRRNSGSTEDPTTMQPNVAPQNVEVAPVEPSAPMQQTPPANTLPPISRPVTQTPPAMTGATAPPASTPAQMINSTVSATGSVIEKGILVVPQLLTMEIGKPQTIDVRIARNPQARISNNNSYDKVVMEALTTQLHAPGQNFHIKSLLPETHWIDHNMQQAQNSADYGQWRWEVTPLQRGATKLSLVVSSRTLNQDNQLSSITLPEKSIEVKVGMNIMSLIIKVVMLATIVGLTIAAALFLPKFM